MFMKDVDSRLQRLESNVAALQGAVLSTPIGAKRVRSEPAAAALSAEPSREGGLLPAAAAAAAAPVAAAAAAAPVAAVAIAAPVAEAAAAAPPALLRGTTEESKKLMSLKKTTAKDQLVDLVVQDFHRIAQSQWVTVGKMGKRDVSVVKNMYSQFMLYATPEQKTWLANTSFAHNVVQRAEKLARLNTLVSELDKKLWGRIEEAERAVLGKGKGKKKRFSSSIGNRLKTIKEAATKLGKPDVYNKLVQKGAEDEDEEEFEEVEEGMEEDMDLDV